MPLLDQLLLTSKLNALSPTTRTSWWHSDYPFRVKVSVQVQKNPLTADETVEAGLSLNLLELLKARSDFADIQVTRLNGANWEEAPTQVSLGESSIDVKFQIIDEIDDSEDYYIYYGNTELVNLEAVPAFAGGEFHNEIDFSSKYISYTNPTEDWVADPTGYVKGSRPGAKIFSELNVERFRILGRKGPDMGTLLVFVDNVLQSEVDLYNATVQTDQELFTYESPGLGETKIRLEVGEKKNFVSSGTNVIIDSIEYDTEATVVVDREETYPKLSWSSSSGVS